MSARRWRLSLIISSLQAGGAERVLSRMASFWAARGHDIEIVSYDRPDARPFYPLHADVVISSKRCGTPPCACAASAAPSANIGRTR
jgi:hypothetical protein